MFSISFAMVFPYWAFLDSSLPNHLPLCTYTVRLFAMELCTDTNHKSLRSCFGIIRVVMVMEQRLQPGADVVVQQVKLLPVLLASHIRALVWVQVLLCCWSSFLLISLRKQQKMVRYSCLCHPCRGTG